MILLIACGNSLRQDDGAGLLLAERLAEAWQRAGQNVRYRPVQQLVPELALEIADPQVMQVLFVDTRVARDENDTAVQMTPLVYMTSSPSLGHHLCPELLLFYAFELFDKRPSIAPPFAWQLTVPGYQFGHSGELSAQSHAIFEQAVNQAFSLVKGIAYA